MSIGNFENIGVEFANWFTTKSYKLSFSGANTWQPSQAPLFTQIENNLSYNAGEILLNDSGIYMVQSVNTFSVNDRDDDLFKMRFFNNTLNEEVASSQIQFHTKGGLIWEVQNMMLINIQPEMNGDFPKTSLTSLSIQYQNNIDVSALSFVSQSLIVIKIV